MKITPMALADAGMPGQSLTTTSASATAAKIAAAKAIAAGQTPNRLTPSTTPIDPVLARNEADIRRIKMKTNASPDRFNSIIQAEEPVGTTIDPIEQAVATTEETKPLSPQFAALAKQRRALQVKEREIADREKALQAAPTNDGSADLVARIKSDPLSVLQEHGVTYDQLTEAILANQNGSNSEIRKLREELKAVKDGVDKNLSDRDAQAETQVLDSMMNEAKQLVKEGDAFEMVRETQSLPDVRELIIRTYRETGEALDVSDALQLVENDLINESMKIANLKKVQSKFQAQQPTPQLQTPQPQGMRTLTSRDTAAPQMTRRERMIAAMNGTLKK